MSPVLHALPDPADARSSLEEERAVRYLKQIGQGETSALDALYQLWSATFLGIAFRMLGNRGEAEECLQDAFVKIWHQAEDYDPRQCKPFVWCFTILRSICIDRLRHSTRQKRDKNQTCELNESNTHGFHEDHRVIASDTLNTVRQAVNSLPEEERRCLELAVFLEYTQREIAAELNTPLGTVKHRLRRAIEKLQILLAPHEI